MWQSLSTLGARGARGDRLFSEDVMLPNQLVKEGAGPSVGLGESIAFSFSSSSPGRKSVASLSSPSIKNDVEFEGSGKKLRLMFEDKQS